MAAKETTKIKAGAPAAATKGGHSNAPANTRQAASVLEKESASQYPLGRKNFILMGIAGAMIIVGFLLMLGGNSTEEAFNPDIFSVRRIVVGPTIAFLGFLFMGYAIIRRPSKDAVKDSGNATDTNDAGATATNGKSSDNNSTAKA